MYVKAILFLGNSSPVFLKKKKKKQFKKTALENSLAAKKQLNKKKTSAVDAQNDLFALKSDWQLTSH